MNDQRGIGPGPLGRACALALCAAAACAPPPRAEGGRTTLGDLVTAARASDPEALQAVAPRGTRLALLSDPFATGAAVVQDPQVDGLVVQPAFSDTHPAAFVMTDQWREFPRVWAQPLYVLVTGFDPRGAPVALPGALPIFSVGPSSRFYSPFWQTYYATVPAGTDPASVRSADRIVAAGYPLTPGPLRLASIGTRELGLSHPAGKPPVHPFTNDALVDHVAQQGFADAGLVFFVDFGASRFRVDDRNVVQETAMFHLALRKPDGSIVPLGLPPVAGTGAFRAARPPDLLNGVPQFGALWHTYTVVLQTLATDPTPGVFVSASRPTLRERMMAQLGSQYVPLPTPAAERLPEREQFTLRVALDGSCFTQTDFPNGCTWLDSQGAVEGNLPATAFVDEKVFFSGALVFFDGSAL